ncbi:hypothetical protein D9619_004972 [Psilocybe cf. subviscida]|uniref:NACHT domain-containing protein n=1 Tax=Psilocybe cf. subviscida TaxID=2480587 RepID=A0A8H5BRE3_9AGAR|nr:hypothetical protein D9619_004972 [Psilocybe cf. subviscida]
MSILQGATHVAITGGTQIAAGPGSCVTINHGGQAGGSSAFQNLSATAAHTAMHDSSARFDAPLCHRNTRTSYLDVLERWMLGHGEEHADARLIWLTGGAGAGKSAIMQSIVERCAQDAVILGTFFFSRADASRDYAEVLIPTLAYQLARAFPAYELLVRPLLYLIESGVIDSTKRLRGVFVIDGLDECDDPQKQALIIHAVAAILSDNVGPISFLIASRPEVAISRAFQRENTLRSMLATITLDDNDEASSDIRQYIEDSFLDILDSHPQRTHIPSNWPGPDSVDELVRKSSGHFIYAATAMKFISSADEHPERALRVVEGLMPPRMGNPFAELDALYLHILTSAKYSRQVLGILRHCIFAALNNSVTAVCFMYPDISPEDIALFLSDVHALISLCPNHAAEMCIVLKHASLSDFLRDAHRSHAIFMSRQEYGAPFLPRYFRLLDNGAHSTTSSLFSGRGGENDVISDLNNAIAHSQDLNLLRSLVSAHSPRDVWNFCVEDLVHYGRESWAHHTKEDWVNCGLISSNSTREFVVLAVSGYIRTIRDSPVNHDNTLYTHQFKMYIQVLMDDLDKLVQTEPQYRIIPALMFSSSPSCLASLVPLLIKHFPQLRISWAYVFHFLNLRPKGANRGTIDPRSYQAIRSLPQTQFSWGSDLAFALERVLRHLVGYSWTPACLCPNPHERWLHRTKLLTLPTPRLGTMTAGFANFVRYGYSPDRARKIWDRRVQCFLLLKIVICYLHKCDGTSELARLARKSLPKAALWFPRLMKRAREGMDAYVVRWGESLDGLVEKSKSLSINEMD